MEPPANPPEPHGAVPPSNGAPPRKVRWWLITVVIVAVMLPFMWPSLRMLLPRPAPPPPPPPPPPEAPLDPGTCTNGAPLPAFDAPQDNLLAWLAADRDAEVDPGTQRITTWRDLGPAHNDFIKRPSDPTPLLVPHAWQCRTALRFDGDQSLMRDDLLGLAPSEGRTFIVVSRLQHHTRRSQVISQDIPGDQAMHVGLDVNTFGTVGERFGAYVTGTAMDSDAKTHRDIAIHVLRINNLNTYAKVDRPAPGGVGLDYRINGVSRPLTVTHGRNDVGEPWVKASRTSIGRFAGQMHFFYNGDMFEVLIYRGALSDSTLHAVETGLAKKYGIPLGAK